MTNIPLEENPDAFVVKTAKDIPMELKAQS